MAHSSNKLTFRLIAIGFFACLFVPLVSSLITPDAEISSAENRSLQALPSWSARESLSSFFTDLTDYANDHFGFREPLITAHKKLMWAAKESPSKYVIRGENDWLFLKVKDPLLTEINYSNQTIKNILKRRIAYLKKMHTELSAKGIVFRHVVAANKMSVYPESLPAIYALTNIDATYDYFRSLLDEDLDSIQIYTRDVVKQHKESNSKFDLYFKNDTHWNDLGAFKVFQRLVESIAQTNPEITITPVAKEFRPFEKYAGDLANYVGLGGGLSAVEPFVDILPCAQAKQITEPRWDVDLSSCNMNDTKVLLVGDSFLYNFYPFISESVGSVYMVKQKISRYRLMKTIEEYQPDIVIEEIVERNLATPIPH